MNKKYCDKCEVFDEYNYCALCGRTKLVDNKAVKEYLLERKESSNPYDLLISCKRAISELFNYNEGFERELADFLLAYISKKK